MTETGYEHMSLLTIWIDADSMPRRVRDITARAGIRHAIPVLFVSNRLVDVSVPSPETEASNPAAVERVQEIAADGEPGWQNGWIANVLVDGTVDTADALIVRNAAAGDLVVTRDLPLAEQLVAADVYAMNDRGILWTWDGIRERRSVRDAALELRMSGRVDGAGERSYGIREAHRFAETFDAFLHRRLDSGV